MNSIGDYLRGVREEKKIPIAQIARDTKINERYIRAIEEGEFSQLPAPAYAKGFIKIYAEYLELDPEPLIQRYLQDHVGFSRQALAIERDTMASNLMAMPWKHTLLGIGAAIVVVAVIISGMAFWKSCARRPVAESRERTEELETLPLPPLPPVEHEEEPAAEEEAAESATEQKMKLSARATKDNVWMKVYVDKVLLFEGIIPRGKDEFWLAEQRIHLRMGRPDAVEFTLDGKRLEIPEGQKEQNLIIEKGGEVTFYKGKMRKEE